MFALNLMKYVTLYFLLYLQKLETSNGGASERPSSFTLPSISAGEPLREEPPAARHTDRDDGRGL